MSEGRIFPFETQTVRLPSQVGGNSLFWIEVMGGSLNDPAVIWGLRHIVGLQIQKQHEKPMYHEELRQHC